MNKFVNRLSKEDEIKPQSIGVLIYVIIFCVHLSTYFMTFIAGPYLRIASYHELAEMFKFAPMFLPIIISLGGAVLSCLSLSKVVKNFSRDPEVLEKLNRKIRLIEMIDIAIPVGTGFLQGVLMGIAVKVRHIQLASFVGANPTLPLIMFSYSMVIVLGLLVYVVHIRIMEPKLHYIGFTKKQISLNLIQRNLLTLVFAFSAFMVLVLSIIMETTFRHLSTAEMVGIFVPLIIYASVYVLIVEFLLLGDVKECVLGIDAVAYSLQNKDYTVTDISPNNRSELGVISQNINTLKTELSGILKDINLSTQKTLAQSEDLVSNMNLTNSNVGNITNAIDDMSMKMRDQAAGVHESNASIEQIMGNIRDLNNAIENQAAGVSQSTASIEEMIGNINSVTSILEKNTVAVNELCNASESGQGVVQVAVKAAEDVIQRSEGILQASSVIQNLATRTNLLAMNAAIESAHAGEAGKGFAVVAEEIRKLAVQSASQSKAIDESLTNLSEAIGNITNDIKKVQNVFATIFDLSRKVQNQEDVIASAMREQTLGNQQILEAMHSINDATNAVKDGSVEMLSGGEQIVTEMRNLQNVTTAVTATMKQIDFYSQQIKDAVVITTSSTNDTKSSLEKLMKKLEEFKLS